MKKRLIIILLILTIVPAVLLGWLGLVSFRTDREHEEERLAELTEERLRTVNLEIENLFLSLESQLNQLPASTGTDIESVRDETRENGLIRQIFLIGENGGLIFPSEGMELSGKEELFLQRVREIGLSEGLLITTGDSEAAAPPPNGWYTWHLGEGINFIYWQRLPVRQGGEQNRNNHQGTGEAVIFGCELNRNALLSRLINALPSTDFPSGNRETDEDFRIVITDVGEEVFYQWGNYSPAGEEESLSELALPFPLNAWRISYFGPLVSSGGAGRRIIAIFTPIAVVVIAMVGLALYLYRESTREVREAMERVTFVNQVSHELKTPLTNIRMYAELLDNRIGKKDPKARNYLQIVEGESRRLSRLIGNVLTFSKEKKSGILLNRGEGNPEEIISSVLESFRLSLDSKEIETEVDLQCAGSVLIDRDIAEQIVSNLISNVEKYGADGRYLFISCRLEGETTLIRVADRGPGIPDSLHDKVFSPFYRISSRLSDGVSGTGIGLSIVRTLARLHEGDAYIVPSETGALFEVTLRTPRTGQKADREE